MPITVVVVALAAVVAGVLVLRPDGGPSAGSDQRPAVSWQSTDSPTTSSSPFTVEWVPDGYDLVTAGTGDRGQTWDQDEFGSEEPFTVLAPVDEDPTAENTVIVAVSGYAGYQGGLAQASAGWVDAESFAVDGHDAYFAAADADTPAPGRNDLVVAVEQRLAVRVAGAGRERAELAAIVPRVRPRGPARAPEVDPPDGLRVVAHADAELVVAVGAGFVTREPQLMAPAGALTAGWTHDGPGAGSDADDAHLIVTTLPGTVGDPAVLPAWHQYFASESRSEVVTAAERPAAYRAQLDADCTQPCEVREAALLTTTSWGDLLLVQASGADVPGPEVLARVAASVSPTAAEAWEAFVVEATGGPGLQADLDMTEVARGTEEGIDWLLQAYPNGSEVDPQLDISFDDVPAGAYVTDPCLKLGNRQRLCPNGHASYGSEAIIRTSRPGVGATADTDAIEGLVVVDTATEATAMRVRAGDQEVVAPLHRLPGEVPRWAGVAFVDRPGIAGCHDAEPPTDIATVRIDLLDGDGQPIRCLGIGAP